MIPSSTCEPLSIHITYCWFTSVVSLEPSLESYACARLRTTNLGHHLLLARGMRSGEKDVRGSAADIIMINYNNTLRAEYQTAATRRQVIRAL